MNRPPSSKDHWWSKHEKECGGKYIKIKEPEGYQKKGKQKKSDSEAGKSGNVKELLEKSLTSSSSQLSSSQSPTTKTSSQSVTQATSDFSGKGHVLGGIKDSTSAKFLTPSEAAAYAAQKRCSQTNESPPSKKIKGLMNYKDKSNNKNISSYFTKNRGKEPIHRTSILKDEVPHSSHTKPEQLVDLTDNKQTVQQDKTSRISLDDNDVPCGSTSQELNGEMVDLTDNKSSCPVCGFSSLPNKLLQVHIELCVKEFYS